jgi:hypothetical protein
MIVVFVHGWSVTDTGAYGGLPKALQQNAPASLNLTIAHLFLAKYVSFADEVRMDDIARGMQQALVEEIFPKLAAGERFACVTHSTGAPVVRKWIDFYYGTKLSKCPLSHLIMLAPANHGSALAQLGKGRLSRLKSFMQSIEPGIGVLNWLELGSDQSWELNMSWLEYDFVDSGLYPFALTGQRIDRHFYDNLNSYTGEPGSDGVIRVAAANMNFGLVRLVQNGSALKIEKERPAAKSALGILPGLSHVGEEMGIMASVKPDDDGQHPTVKWVLRCLEVASATGYVKLVKDLEALTEQTQEAERIERVKELFLFERTFKTSRYCMMIFKITDDRGFPIADYDVFFTAGPGYDPNHLPKGFFVDRQRNSLNPGKLTYYVDYDVMIAGLERPKLEGRLGFRIVGRPGIGGFAYYVPLEYQGKLTDFRRFFEANRTLMIEVVLKRHVDAGVFRTTSNLEKEETNRKPLANDVP